MLKSVEHGTALISRVSGASLAGKLSAVTVDEDMMCSLIELPLEQHPEYELVMCVENNRRQWLWKL